MKQLNLIFFFLFFLFFSNSLFSQTATNKQIVEKNKWFSTVGTGITTENFFDKKHQDFGLEIPESMQQQKVIAGKNGLKHFKFQQFYKGIKVLGGEYILHEQNGELKNANGKIFPNIEIATQSKISSIGFESIIQNHVLKEEVEKQKANKSEGFYHSEFEVEPLELVVVDKAFPNVSGEYVLAQILEVEFPVFPPQRDHYIINTQSGEVINVLPQICHTEVEGKVKTLYSGEQTITVDSVAPNRFLMQDFTRGNGIITINDVTNKPFEDEDNYWDNFNSNKDEAAGDAHYGAISFYDYLKDKFGWNGLDNKGKELISVIHIREGASFVNAFWNGEESSFGDGNCGEYGPLTSLDVVGHEFAHGLTEFSSGLIYAGESGGLNEGMSDIFGKALEYYFCQPGTFNWDVGGAFVTGTDTEPFRSMKDPNLYENPKFYKGLFWDFDNQSVHNLSGVFGHWFYLLVEGGQGVNEVGDAFDVPSIGMDKAMEIVFAIETGYLTSSTNYHEAAAASVETAEAIYGANSDEKKSVEAAWSAVGVQLKMGIIQNDLTLQLLNTDGLVCGPSEFSVGFRVINEGALTVSAGQVIEVELALEEFFGFQIIDQQIFEIPDELLFGEYSDFEFSNKLSHTVLSNAWSPRISVNFSETYSDDFNPNNKSNALEIVAVESDDLSLELFSYTQSGVLCKPDSIEVIIDVFNNSCEELPIGTPYQISYFIQNQGFVINDVLNFELKAGQEFTRSESFPIDTNLPFSDVILDFEMMGKSISESESIYLIEPTSTFFVENFENFDPLEATGKILIRNYFFSEVFNFLGDNFLMVKGFDFNEGLISEDCTDEEERANEIFDAGITLEMCVDATGIPNPYLSFEMIQFFSEREGVGHTKEEGAMARVRFEDGSGIDSKLIKGQPEGEIILNQFQLPDNYVGSISIDMIAILGIFDNNLDLHDFVMIDDITIGSGLVKTESIQKTDEFEVYPNPASEMIWFVDKSLDLKSFDVEMFDALGKRTKRVQNLNGTGSIDISDFSKGIYFYKIDLKNGDFLTGKFFVN